MLHNKEGILTNRKVVRRCNPKRETECRGHQLTVLQSLPRALLACLRRPPPTPPYSSLSFPLFSLYLLYIISFLLPSRSRRMSFFSRKRQTTNHAPSSSTQVTVGQSASQALAQTKEAAEKQALAQRQQQQEAQAQAQALAQQQAQAQVQQQQIARERDLASSSVDSFCIIPCIYSSSLFIRQPTAKRREINEKETDRPFPITALLPPADLQNRRHTRGRRAVCSFLLLLFSLNQVSHHPLVPHPHPFLDTVTPCPPLRRKQENYCFLVVW